MTTKRPSFTDQEALDFHAQPMPGKISMMPTKPMQTQRDLSLAYSPGVAVPVEAIGKDADLAYDYTAKGNMVAVISNGTAILGLGDLGPMASKPVMEGKSVLFKRFADVNSIDIELDTEDPDAFCNAVRLMGPTFGGVNLEDIKAPECFIIEQRLKEEMDIPVFHDDQHGTAIVVAAAILNGLRVVGKDLDKIKLVTSGAGAAAIACLNLLVSMGLPRANITVADRDGVLYEGRKEDMEPQRAVYAQKTEKRTLADATERQRRAS